MDYRLRQATLDDYEYMRQTGHAGLRPYIESLGDWDQAEQNAGFRRVFDPANQFIIQCGDEAVGYLHTNDDGTAIFLAGLYIDEKHRRRGLGTVIIRDILLHAGKSGKSVHLRVHKPNPAGRLYRRLGFRVVQETEAQFIMRWSPP